MSKKRKNKISVYLIKDSLTDYSEIVVDEYAGSQDVDIGKIFFGKSFQKKPVWADKFLENVLSDDLFTANARAVLIVPINKDDTIRFFAIVMGYGRSLLRDGGIEERFGLKTILNTIQPDSLRRINKTNLGSSQKISYEQLPTPSNVSAFGFDVEQDLVSRISGLSNDDNFIKGIIEGDSILSFSTEDSLSTIKPLLEKILNRYLLDNYKQDFEWVDNLCPIKDKIVISQLNDKLIEEINNNSENIYMACPDILDWSDFQSFEICNKEYNYISADNFNDAVGEKIANLEQLKSYKISYISAENGQKVKSWNAYKCVGGEIEFNNKIYCLNNGKWYCIDDGYKNNIENFYNAVPISNIDFIPYSQSSYTTEKEYNISFATQNNYFDLDAQLISYGGGHSKIELCDILTPNTDMIHIKKYSSSSVMSHLFMQGLVSRELIKSDNEFLQKANEKLYELNIDLSFDRTKQIKVIYGIITNKEDSGRPHLPFFSKVALKNTIKRLNTLDVVVELKAIKITD